jgi:L-fuconolactonase
VVVLMPMMSDNPRALPAAMRRIGELAARFPRLNIVLDHFGFPVAERTATFGFSPEHLALADHRNVHHKYSTFLLEVLRRGGVPDRDFLYFAVATYGADRVLWGSDFGNTPGEFGAFVRRALDSAVDLAPVQQRAIFYENGMNLFARQSPAVEGRCS